MSTLKNLKSDLPETHLINQISNRKQIFHALFRIRTTNDKNANSALKKVRTKSNRQSKYKINAVENFPNTFSDDPKTSSSQNKPRKERRCQPAQINTLVQINHLVHVKNTILVKQAHLHYHSVGCFLKGAVLWDFPFYILESV